MDYFGVLNDYQQNFDEDLVPKFLLASLLGFQQMNGLIYGLIFYRLYQHEISMSKILRPEDVRRRIKRDVRSFSIEFYRYLIENLFVIGLIVSTSSSNSQTRFNLVGPLGCGMSVEFMLKSVFQILLCFRQYYHVKS